MLATDTYGGHWPTSLTKGTPAMEIHKEILEWQAPHPTVNWIVWGTIWVIVFILLFSPKRTGQSVDNRAAILRSKKSLRDGTNGCTDLHCSVQAFDEVGGEALDGLKRRAIRLQRHLREESSLPCFTPQNCGAVSRYSARPGRVLTIARLPRFYNKFCLQSDRSTTNAERAADLKLARLWHVRRELELAR